MVGTKVCTSVDFASFKASCWSDNGMDCGDSGSNSPVLSDIRTLMSVIFSMSVQTARSCVRTQLAESSFSQHVRTAQRMQVTVRSCSITCLDTQRTQVPESPYSVSCPDTEVKTTNTEKFFKQMSRH
jgi:hypothetical protein